MVEELHKAGGDMDIRAAVLPAASIKITFVVGSSLSRFASTQPAEPAPTIT